MLFAAYFLEAGLILVVAPWSGLWDRNFFAESAPAFEQLLSSPFVRGGVSGIGLITAVAGLAEIGAAFASRRRAPEPSADSTLRSDG
jgi:hypothetical protein